MATPTDELHGCELQAPVAAVQVHQRLHQKLVVAVEVALHLGWWGRRRVSEGHWPSCSLALSSKPERVRAMTPGCVQGWSRAGNLDPWQGCSSAGPTLLTPISGGILPPGRPFLVQSRCLPGMASAPSGNTLGHQSPQCAGGLQVSSVQWRMHGDPVSCCSSGPRSGALSAPGACGCHS